MVIIQKHQEGYGNIIENMEIYGNIILKELKSGFKRTINWNKYQYKEENKEQNSYFD